MIERIATPKYEKETIATPCNQSELIEALDFNVGDKVMDRNGDVGTVLNVDDPHNIQVEYDNIGVGLFCLCADCEMYEPLTKI